MVLTHTHNRSGSSLDSQGNSEDSGSELMDPSHTPLDTKVAHPCVFSPSEGSKEYLDLVPRLIQELNVQLPREARIRVSRQD